ncbi:MAG: NAD-dependent epimerase/dehydratase family protein [Vicinamibacteria bacterium]|jgi:farnesol dehydrogenase|nr:NAD-dependent epimerase/dehydratase family protein [Vicinamibacteria bacterium]
MKILLTGGTGFLGKNVARALVASGHQLVVLARPNSRLEGLPEKVERAAGDVTDCDSLRRAANGCDAIVHMAALVKIWVPERELYDAVNVGGVRHALIVAAEKNIRLVHTSSFMAIGPTSAAPADETRVHAGRGYCNDYERTKAIGDGLARAAAQAGQDVVSLYPGVIYGPGDLTEGNIVVKLILDYLRGRLPGIIGPGDRLWSYAYVEDVAAGHVQALTRGRAGERYLLCGDNVSLARLLEQIAEISGQRRAIRRIPFGLAKAAGLAAYFWAELTGYTPRFTHEVVEVFRKHWAYSSAKAERELGYRARPLTEGLRSTFAWLKAAGMI